MHKLFDVVRHPVDHLPHALGSSGLIATIAGAIDANALYTWGGVVIALFALFLGTIRKEKAANHAADHAAKVQEINLDWLKFITEYRKKRIEDTGTDPFVNGAPPLDPREMMETKEAASA